MREDFIVLDRSSDSDEIKAELFQYRELPPLPRLLFDVSEMKF